MNCHSSILDSIGNTPLVELRRIVESRHLSGRLLAKLEYLNPGGSMKDRVALEIMREAKTNGSLRDSQPVVELTSGNTGTGLAIVCRAMGHPFTAVMSSGNSPERAAMMRAFGAEVVLVPQAPGSPAGQVSGEDLALVEQKTQEIARERNAFRADQFHNPANPLAHERHTGPEIWEQSGGRVDVFLHFAGTAGSFAGTTRFLRRKNPKLRAYLVEPAGAPVLAGQPITSAHHVIQGGGYSLKKLTHLEASEITDFLRCRDEQAITGSRALAAEEGILAGFSSGAHVSAALELLSTREAGSTIAFLICDSGMKYLSANLFTNGSSEEVIP